MDAIDLSKMSLDELKQLQKKVANRIKAVDRKEKKKVLAKMQELAADAGMTPSEVAAHFGGSRSKGTPKYHNPDNPGQTWTGKGRRPGWLQALIDQGGSLEDYEVKS